MHIDVLPHHEEYEQGILGAVLVDAKLYPQVKHVLDFPDFYFEKHRVIFAAMTEMSRECIPIDLVTLYKKLESGGKAEKAGDSLYLTHLTDQACLADNIHFYISEVKKDAERRSLWYSLIDTAEAIRARKPDEEIEKQLEKVLDRSVKKSERTLKPVSAKDLESTDPPVSYWADIVYPGCLIQLNAVPGIGKSTFAYNICALGALGKPFLEIEFLRPIKSLYVDLETPRQLRANKIKLIAGELPKDFQILDSLELRGDFTELMTLCKEEKYDLVVLDTQSRVLAMEQENDNSEANSLAKLLRRLSNETGCAILLIHHSTKGEGGRAVYRGRGASAIAGAVDVVLNMQSLSDDTVKLSVDKHRIQGSRPDLIIRKCGEDRFEQASTEHTEGASETGFEIFTVQERILELLRDQKAPLKTKDIVQDSQYELNVNRRMVERALSGLAQAGKVHRIKLGYYSLHPEDSDSPTTTLPLSNGGDVGVSENQSVIPAHEPESHLLPLDLSSDDPEELYEIFIKRLDETHSQELESYIENNLPELKKELKTCEERINDWFINRKSVQELRNALLNYWVTYLKAINSTKA